MPPAKDLELRLRQTWPEAVVDDAFLAHLERRSIHEAHVGDAFLAWACAHHEAWALAVFERELIPRAVAAARSVDKTGALDDEVTAQLRATLLVGTAERPPRMLEYAGTGPLENWVRSAAMRTALNLLPRRAPAEPLEAAVALAGPDPELEFLKSTYRAEFKRAFEEALGKLPADQLALLRLHVVEHVGIDQLSAMYQVHRATAARRITRAREELCELTRASLSAQLGLPDDELDSVMNLVRSNVDLSLVRLLRR